MSSNRISLALLGLCIASPLSIAQVGIHNNLIEFCDSFSDGAETIDFTINASGNLYAIAESTNGELFTTIKYFGNATPPVFTTFFPPVFAEVSAGIVGSVAFSGDTLVYAGWIDHPSQTYTTVALQLYDVDPSSGDLTLGDTIFMPTSTDRLSTLRPAISAEEGQFAVYGGFTGGGTPISRVNIYRQDVSGWSLDGSIDSIAETSVRDIAIEGDTVVIGYLNNSVHIYVRDELSGWQFDQAILPNMGDVVGAIQSFGKRVSIRNGLIAISDPRVRTYNPQLDRDERTGAVFVYDYSGGVVTHLETLFEHDGTLSSSARLFGNTLSFSDDGSALLVGVPEWDVVANEYWNTGSVFVYPTNDLSSYDEMYYDSNYQDSSSGSYGNVAKFSGNSLAVLTRNFTGGNCSNYTPAFLIYENAIGAQPCNAADFALPFGTLNFLDVSLFLQLFNANDMSADLTNDSALNFLDISAFLQLYSAGCP